MERLEVVVPVTLLIVFSLRRASQADSGSNAR